MITRTIKFDDKDIMEHMASSGVEREVIDSLGKEDFNKITQNIADRMKGIKFSFTFPFPQDRIGKSIERESKRTGIPEDKFRSNLEYNMGLLQKAFEMVAITMVISLDGDELKSFCDKITDAIYELMTSFVNKKASKAYLLESMSKTLDDLLSMLGNKKGEDDSNEA
jgi:hypothetical protein